MPLLRYNRTNFFYHHFQLRQKEQEELMRKSQNLKEFKEASKQNAENNKNLMLSKIKNDVDTMKKIKKVHIAFFSFRLS